MARQNTSVEHSSFQKILYLQPAMLEHQCFIKPFEGQIIRLKPGYVPTKFVFTVDLPVVAVHYQK
jgi:hypothetical protein